MEIQEDCVPVNVEKDGTIAACICTTDFCNGIDYTLAPIISENKVSTDKEEILDEIDITFKEIEETTTLKPLISIEKAKFSQVICHQCGSLFSNKNSDCQVFDENDPSQEGFCQPGEACLWYSWQKTKVAFKPNGNTFLLLFAIFLLAEYHLQPIKLYCLFNSMFIFRIKQRMCGNVSQHQSC